ncbi:tetratricopeptide (TPR) repeat protein [Streptomyces sp. LBL]|uniref:hypothetical protein n=1 Tax=Streptomyces sp. LBL TaxID=2940562 RepID=UPI0024753979|nr:hypothetical protein [Streptomyces sp. LBL]MDH6626262.1 tetratricopeptide (TPR) repeat protein [Streptomyces sp. LBL]
MDDRETRRIGYSLTIPDTLLQSDAMRGACATRDFQEVFRLVNRRTGSSYAVMAAAVGKMTSSRVSDVIRGVRRIRGQEVIERVADGFGIPGEMLGLPQRPWEGSPEKVHLPQPPTYADPSREAADTAYLLPQSDEQALTAAHSDVLLVSVWIEGRKQIVPISRRSMVTGAIGAALQAGDLARIPAPATEFNPMPASFPKLDPTRIEAAIEHLRDMWHSLVRADNLFGPRHALTAVRQQLFILESLLAYARGAQRSELLRLAAQYAESAAWLHEDSADMSNATKWTSQAMEWATEAGDQSMVTWTLFRRSQQATTKRNAAQVISLAQAAQRNSSTLTRPMRAAAIQQEAHGYALDADEVSCHTRLDDAHDFAASPDTKGDARSGHGDFCTASYIEIQRANCWLTLGRPDLAVPLFETALDELPNSYQRDRGLAQARLALAYAGIREYDSAAAQATSALSIARSSGSLRTMHETVFAVNALGEVHTSQAVSQLFDAIKEERGF